MNPNAPGVSSWAAALRELHAAGGAAKVRGGSAGQVRERQGWSRKGESSAPRSGARVGPSRRHTAAPPPAAEPGVPPPALDALRLVPSLPSARRAPLGRWAAVPRYRPCPGTCAGGAPGSRAPRPGRSSGQSSRRRRRAGKAGKGREGRAGPRG